MSFFSGPLGFLGHMSFLEKSFLAIQLFLERVSRSCWVSWSFKFSWSYEFSWKGFLGHISFLGPFCFLAHMSFLGKGFMVMLVFLDL